MTETTLDAVAGMIAVVMGDELVDEPITMETSFAEDLELESIEFVALAEQVQARWGDAVDFTGWLAGKSLDEVIGLTVGDLVEHVDSCLS